MNDQQTTTSPLTGTRQNQRQLPSLDPGYVSVEERSTEDWLHYLNRFASWLQFHTPEGVQGNWQVLLEEPEGLSHWVSWLENQPGVSAAVKEHTAIPSRALLLAFLHLLRHPRDQFNRFTDRHLQYYFRNVLGFIERPAEPDQAHLVLTLEEEADLQTLPADTLFDAGDDEQGEVRSYRLLETSAVNHALVHSVRTLGLDTVGMNTGFLRTDLVNLDSGLEFPARGALSFGEFTPMEQDQDARQSRPDVGLLVSSPLLWLSEGERRIRLIFSETLTEALIRENLNPVQLFHSFQVAISTVEGTVVLEDDQVVGGVVTDPTIQPYIEISVDPLFPAIEQVPEPASPLITAPFIQLTLKSDNNDADGIHRIKDYQLLSRLPLDHITLDVQVSGLKQIMIRNDNGGLDTGGAMTLFGNQPRTGSRFQFTHPELALKPIDSMAISVSWIGKPDFDSHYQTYRDYLERDGDDYANWPEHKLTMGSPFANEAPGLATPLFAGDIQRHNLDAMYPENYEWTRYNELPHASMAPRTWPFWYQFALSEDDFGHGIYSQVRAWASLLDSQAIMNGEEYTPTETNEPWTPEVESLSVSYTASEQLNVENARGDNDRLLMHIHPVGNQVLANSERLTSGYPAVVPALSEAGYLYIGIGNTPENGTINVLFQLSPVDSPDGLSAAKVRWYYLTEEGWTPFGTDRQQEGNQRALLLSDSTNTLLDTGIIRFEMLPDMRRAGAFAGDNQLWLRASLEDVPDNLRAEWSRMSGTHTQALTVEFNTDTNTPRHLPDVLPAETIANMVEQNAAVATVLQPGPSFGGKPPESSDTFYNRVSERLRHRGRAITCWDYERLVLENFPQLFLAKCIRDSSQPGAITLLVIPKTSDPTLLKPRTPLYLQQDIEDYLESLMPQGARLTVTTPRFQEVRFSLFINIREGYDQGLMIQTLNNELVSHLSPWTANSSSSSRNSITLSSIATFAAGRPYIERVLKVGAQTMQWGAEEEASLKPVSGSVVYPGDGLGSPDEVILVPAPVHTINVLASGITVYEGIERMEVGLDFRIPDFDTDFDDGISKMAIYDESDNSTIDEPHFEVTADF